MMSKKMKDLKINPRAGKLKRKTLVEMDMDGLQEN